MSVFKCKMCGGTIEFERGATVGVCDSCGTKQTLPRLDSDRKTNLYDRANHFRRNNEFDKAMSIYENILNEDQSDAEAYWSIVLCRYGIEYVEDPATHKRVPTVNRAQFTSIFDDEDYKSALKNADAQQRSIYEDEAKTINEIQKGILEISAKEEPFDVFICYKETDANGRRTPDSVLATDLYHQLTNEGFKVFFSRITLEDKLGQEYEPYIFAALNSAKAMVVMGTRPEHFNAVWVKNEWSRYLALIKAGAKKTLIPAYRDMDPYDLPEEFSHLQAQDMSKLGFMQDLIRGIKKIVRTDEPKQTTIRETVVQQAAQTNTAPLLRRAFMFLEDGNFASADEYCEKVLDLDPENAEAYLGKLMAELKVRNRDALKDQPQPFDDRNNYKKAYRFGDDKLKAKLSGDIAFINERNENARLTGIYNNGVRAMNAASTETAYKSAAAAFKTIPGFKDADALADRCLEQAEICRKDAIYQGARTKMIRSTVSDYESAIQSFRTIPGWKDADDQILACERKIEEIKAKEEADRLERERKAEEARIAAEKRKKRNKKIVLIVLAVVAFAVAAVILFFTVIQPKSLFLKQKAGLKNITVGSTIKYGFYEQDNNTSNGKEEIEWKVLAVEGNKALIISQYALDCQRYNSTYTDATWEKCTLRTWLNGTFYNAAFGSNHQNMIISSTVTADKNPSYSTSPGNSTADKVFLLSITEVKKYFKSDDARKCVPTDYAIAQGAHKGGNGNCWWWLRSPGFDSHHAAGVNYDGSVSNYYDVNRGIIAVRPAMWINIE